MNDRMIRLFLSSTFRDFKEERNLLNRFVFSELEAYCRERGVSFQVIDLRWGIPEQSAQNNETMQICLDEIERCQKLSPEMNFLILSGARYGWIPLPGFISAADWQLLSARMTVREHTLLSQWYLPDENDRKGAYVLRKRSEAEEAEWESTEKMLQSILFPAAGQCMEGDALVPYGLSATEQEIYRGFLTVVNENSLRNTLVLLKDPAGTRGAAMSLDKGVAELREKIIRRIGKENARDQILRYNTYEDSTWMRHVYDFLRKRIDQQIARIQTRDAKEEEKTRFTGELELAEKNYLHRPVEERRFEDFLAGHNGSVLLIQGEFGSGKSTWLKHWFLSHREQAAACFSDTLPHGKSILYAIRFCVDQLVSLEYLKAPATSPDYENLVSWFNETLNQVRSPVPVTLILDSADQMTDWEQVAGSLFDLKLKKNVRVLVVCADRAALTENDRRAEPSAFCWKLLDRGESLAWLDAYLESSGRRLCESQRNQISAALPEQCTALYIYCLSVLCAAQRSFEPIDYELPGSAAGMARLLFDRQAKNYYPVFYRHAAGYLALSDQGLSELELLEILSSDREVTDEIHAQTEWEWDENFHIPTVLWSRLYCMISSLLAEGYSGGVLTLRFRHSLLDRICLADSEAGILRPDEEKRLSVRIRDYFDGERQPWIFASGVVNLRKLQEFYSILAYLADWDRIGQLLSEPDYPNAMLLAGRYQELLSQMLLFRKTRGFTAVQEKILDMLLSRPMLFQTWGQCFLSCAAGKGIWEPGALKDYGAFFYLEQKTASENSGEEIFYLPNSRSYPLAFREDRVLAMFIQEKKNALIRLYDLHGGRCRDLGVTAVFREDTSLSEGVRMFWKEDYLIVRTRRSRHYFRYEADTGDLYEERRVSCADWGRIYKRNGIVSDAEEAWEVNVFHNKSGNTDEGFWSVSCYGEDGFQNYTLPFEDEAELRISCFYTNAAVFRYGADVRILDLEKNQEIGRFACPRCRDLYWSSSGAELLIVRNDNWLQVLPAHADGEKYQAPLQQTLTAAKSDARIEYNAIRGFGKSFPCSFDFYAGIFSENYYAEKLPVCAAMSVEKDWCAFCYRYRWQSAVVVLRLSDGERIAYFQTDPIYVSDTRGPVFYAADHGKQLILVSRQKRHVLDMTACLKESGPAVAREKVLVKKENVQENEPVFPDEVQGCLRVGYADRMKTWLPKTERRALFGKCISSYITLLWGNRFSLIPDRGRFELDRLSHLPVFEQNGRYWLIDAERSMIHVCDSGGIWLCHEQTEKPFLAADVIGDTLYLLSGDTSDVWEYHLNMNEDAFQEFDADRDETAVRGHDAERYEAAVRRYGTDRNEAVVREPDASHVPAGERKPKCKDKIKKGESRSLIPELAVKLGTVLVIILLILAVRSDHSPNGLIYVRFETSGEAGIEPEDMSFVAIDKEDFSQYSVSRDANSLRSSLRLSAGTYDLYAVCDGYAILYDDFTVKGSVNNADVNIDNIIFRFVKIDFYDDDGNPVSPENLSVIKKEEGTIGTEDASVLDVSGNTCYIYEENTCAEIQYLITADAWEPVKISVDMENCRTCGISVVLSQSGEADAVYTTEKPNQDRLLVVCLLNEDANIADADVYIDRISEDGQVTDTDFYTGKTLYVLELEEGCYEIRIECGGYEKTERVCVMDEDINACVMYLNLNASQE